MKQIDWNIIDRQLEGGLSPEDEQQFKEWYEDRPENKAYFDKIQTFHRQEGYAKEVTDQDAEASWQKFSCRVRQQSKRRKMRALYASVSGVAACLVLGFVILQLAGKETRTAPAKQENLIAAGGHKASLWLSNGEKIELEGEARELTEAAAKIVNTGSALSYEQAQAGATAETAMNRVETPRGGEYGITLSDGTKVYLGALSKIEYPVVFGKDKREVKASGEIFFDVAKDAERPFIVRTGDLHVEVLGTSFNLRNYADEGYAEATLVTGKIKLRTEGGDCILEPDHQAVLDKENRLLTTQKVDVSEYVDWKQGKFNVRNKRLEDILERLSKWYDIYVFYLNEEAKDLRFYINIDRYNDMNELLDKLEQTGQVDFTVKGNVVNVALK